MRTFLACLIAAPGMLIALAGAMFIGFGVFDAVAWFVWKEGSFGAALSSALSSALLGVVFTVVGSALCWAGTKIMK